MAGNIPLSVFDKRNQIASNSAGLKPDINQFYNQPAPQNAPSLGSYQQGDNPIMYGLAKGQEFLSQSSLLPVAYAVMGGIIGKNNPMVTGGMAGVGDLLKSQLKPENAGLRKPEIQDLIGLNNPLNQGLTPFNKPFQSEDIVGAGKTAAEAALFQKAFNLLPQAKQLLNPRSYFGKAQKAAVSKYPKFPVDKFKDKILDAVTNETRLNPAGETYAENVLGGVNNATNLDDVLKLVKGWGDAYKQGGGVKSGPGAKVLDVAYKAGRQVIKDKAPEVAKQTARLKATYQIPKMAKKALWYGALLNLARSKIGGVTGIDVGGE